MRPNMTNGIEAMAPNDFFTLQITKAGATVRETRFEQDSLILGSGSGAAIQLEDPNVSGLHVMLKREKNGITAIDLGSEHGTLIGGNRIRQPVMLNPGDVLHIGSYEVKVLAGDPQQKVEIFELAPLASTQPAAAPVARKGGHPIHAAMALATSAARAYQPRPARTPAPARAPEVRPLAQNEAQAWKLLAGPVPQDAQPTPDAHVLQVSLVWGDQLLAVDHFADEREVSIGDARGCDFAIFAPEVGPKLALARGNGGKVALQVPGGAELTVWRGEEELSGDTLLRNGRLGADGRITLDLDERARVRFDTVGLLVRQVRPSPKIEIKENKTELAFYVIAMLAIAGLFGTMTWLALHPTPPDNLAAEVERSSTSYVQFLAKKTPPSPKKPVKKLSGVEEGAKAEKEEGKMGTPEAQQEEAAPSKKGSPVVQPDKKEADRKKVMKSGLLGAIRQNGASDVFGPGGLGSGINDALGGLKGGAQVGDAKGIGGLGSRGTGQGAGGTGLGIGGLGTKGMGRGKGGFGSVDLGGKGHEVTKIIPGKTTVVGGLSKDVIERVIKQHASEIKYCYEIELNQHPDLAGKVGVTWNIDATGIVSDANVTETTLNDSVTEQCMVQKVRRWKFPQAAGGGSTQVTFPWIFKPAGD
jgi:pSer/pThr/pTyr-binding forkhead associated (FHA) protein